MEPVSICTMKLYPVIEIETGMEQWTYEQPDCQIERNFRNQMLNHESVALNDESLGDEFMPLMDRKGNLNFKKFTIFTNFPLQKVQDNCVDFKVTIVLKVLCANIQKTILTLRNTRKGSESSKKT